MTNGSPWRLAGVAALLATLVVASCADVHPVTSGTQGLMTGPGGPADPATGGQGNNAPANNIR